MDKLLDKGVEIATQKERENATLSAFITAGGVLGGALLGGFGMAVIGTTPLNLAFVAVLGAVGGAVPGAWQYMTGKQYLENKQEMFAQHREQTAEYAVKSVLDGSKPI